MRRQIGLGVLVVIGLLGGCSATTSGTSTTAGASSTTAGTSTTTAGTSTSAPPGSLNVTPCNYAQAWHDDPTRFSEFATLARYARKAENTQLRAEGQQLTPAARSHDSAAMSALTGHIFTTCRQLDLVTSSRAAPSTTA